MTSSQPNKKILVLGSGVSGLSCGILLLKAGYQIDIWAKDLPPNTTSNIAAAIWYPYLCNPKDKATVWSGETVNYLKENALDDPNSGCAVRTFTEVFDDKVGDPWWENAVESYRHAQPEELPKGYVDGYHIDAILTDAPIYMNWLTNQYKELGGTVQQRSISDIQEAFSEYDTVVNCTGLGSRELFKDERIYPVRGQVVVVKPNGFERVVADDEGHNKLAYIIPRIHDTVLGGTSQPNSWSLEVDPQDTADILRKVKLLSPAFENVEVIEEKVGLRPARDEVRLELKPLVTKLSFITMDMVAQASLFRGVAPKKWSS